MRASLRSSDMSAACHGPGASGLEWAKLYETLNAVLFRPLLCPAAPSGLPRCPVCQMCVPETGAGNGLRRFAICGVILAFRNKTNDYLILTEN